MKNKDKAYMSLALSFSLRAKGKTFPNPLVGAVLVKNNRIISQGYHKKAGSDHAEIVALKKAGKRAKGATLYITLEPCTHHGRTPPCVKEIIKFGIKRVVVGMLDPNPINTLRGKAILKSHGIKVKTGVLEKEVKKVNRWFIKYITKGIPYVTVKVGQSLDGRIATSRFQSKWITSDKARSFSHRQRRYFDSVMLGINTVIKDDPRLKEFKTKIIIDSNLRIPLNSKLFDGSSRVIIACINSRMKELEGMVGKIDHLKQKNVTIIKLKQKKGKVDSKQLMRKLADLEISNILVEGGGELIGSLFDNKLVDRIMFFVAPKIIGGKTAVSSVEGQGNDLLYHSAKINNLTVKQISCDYLFDGEVEY